MFIFDIQHLSLVLNKGIFNKGMFNKEIFNNVIFNKGIFNKGIFHIRICANFSIVFVNILLKLPESPQVALDLQNNSLPKI
jgi:hypothetical protein